MIDTLFLMGVVGSRTFRLFSHVVHKYYDGSLVTGIFFRVDNLIMMSIEASLP